MSFIKKVMNILVKVSKGILATLMAVMVISMFVQVVTRYALDTGLPWTEELARFANVWLVFIGGSVLAFSDEHIKVTIFDNLLKEKGLFILHFIRNIIQLTYSVILIKVGIDSLSIVASQTSPNMLIAMNYIYIAIPIGALLTVIYVLTNSISETKGENNG